MKCSEAEELMMKYMDNELSEKDAKLLNEHLLVCSECKESFYIYDSLIGDIMLMPDFEAPADFESNVMAEIRKISEEEYKVTYSIKNKIYGIIWGSFSLLFGTGTMLVLYREPIMTSLLNNPYIGNNVARLIPVSETITEQGEIIKGAADAAFNILNNTVANSIGIILAVLTVICAAQFIILRSKKHTK